MFFHFFRYLFFFSFAIFKTKTHIIRKNEQQKTFPKWQFVSSELFISLTECWLLGKEVEPMNGVLRAGMLTGHCLQ